MAIPVAVVGASGYGARELFALLARHPLAHCVAATSREAGRPAVAELHPSLHGRVDLVCETFDAAALAGRVRCAFLALPHGAAAEAAAPLLDRGVKVIDLSADYRLRDPETYAAWYKVPHADRKNLAEAVYGLPELFADRIKTARLVANPGCYPTSAILGLAPLLADGLAELSGIVIDSKSGISGAGRTPSAKTHFPECNDAMSAYNIGVHRHTPEIEQALSDLAGQPVSTIFTPHLAPMDRGIHGTLYARLCQPLDDAALLARYRDFYAGKPFVRVREQPPSTKDSVGTNFCDIAVRSVKGMAVVVSCLDNLTKGAAGQAVQNFNLMHGCPETAGLL